MTLENKCQRHWQALGITNTESLKDFITTLFTKHDHQEKVLIDLYKLVFPEWDCISKIQVITGIWLKCPEVTSRV